MRADAATAQRILGIILEPDKGRTIEDTDKGPVVIWGACLIPVGRFTRNGETGYVVDVVTAIDPDTVIRGLILMAGEANGTRFMTWCAQHCIPQPDSKAVRKIINGLVSDPLASEEVTYVDGAGEIEHGLWALANGVMADGEFVPMEHGSHRTASSGRRIVYAPSSACEEECSVEAIDDEDRTAIAMWCSDLVDMYGSMAPILQAAWTRATVMRSRIETVDAQIPVEYVCGDSHRGKTLMATVCMRMLGSKGERPHANMTSSSNVGVFLVAASRRSLPFVMDEVKPYTGIHDNDLIKSLVNGDIPAKATRSGRLRSSTRVASMPILVSEFAPGDTSSLTNRVFTLNLVTLSACAKSQYIPSWVWWHDKYRDMYGRWAHSIYEHASLYTDDAFENAWRECYHNATVICDDAGVVMNRSLTATTIMLLGFRLLNQDAGGRLNYMYADFCNALSACLLEMNRLIVDVSPMGRFITALRSGWASMEGRYSKVAVDRVFAYSEKHGFVVDATLLHGMLVDSRRLDPSRLGNTSTVGMILMGEGFSIIKDDKSMRGRYSLSVPKMLKKVWAYDMTRLVRLMDCSCGMYLTNAFDNQPGEN